MMIEVPFLVEEEEEPLEPLRMEHFYSWLFFLALIWEYDNFEVGNPQLCCEYCPCGRSVGLELRMFCRSGDNPGRSLQ